MLRELNEGLVQVYALLKTASDMSFAEHLLADRNLGSGWTTRLGTENPLARSQLRRSV